MAVVYGMLSSPPRHPDHDVLTACRENDLLACAFSSWIPAVNLPSRIGLLLDCDQQPHLHDSSASLLPTAWLDNVQTNPPIARCLRGGVCLAAASTRSSKRCYVGTSALLSFLLRSFGDEGSLFVKVDSDTLVLPHRIATWTASLLSNVTSGAKIYSGSTLRTVNFVHCEGPCRLDWQCRKGELRTRNRTCLRSSDDFVRLEEDISGIQNTAERAKLRKFCADHSGVKMSQLANVLAPPGFESAREAMASGICNPIEYARGGAYVLSRAVLKAIVASDCIQRVAKVKCAGWGEDDCEWSTSHEDAAVGVCASLTGVRKVLHNDCLSAYGVSTHHLHPNVIIPGKITNGQAKCPHHKYSISTFFTIHPIKNGTTINEMYNSMVASDRVYNRLPQERDHTTTLPWCSTSHDLTLSGSWRPMTSEEIHHTASTTCTDAGGRNAPVVYGPWNSTDHACWMKAGNLGNGSSQLVYQYNHCSLPVAPRHLRLSTTAAAGGGDGAAGGSEQPVHCESGGHIRFIGDSVSMQHARSFSCFYSPHCKMSTDGWGVKVPGDCGGIGNGWLVGEAQHLLTTAGYDNSTIKSLITFIKTHSGIREAEYCECGSVSRIRVNELPPLNLIPSLMHLVMHLGRAVRGLEPLGAHPADTVVMNVGLWGKSHGKTASSHSSKSIAPLVSWWGEQLQMQQQHGNIEAQHGMKTHHHHQLPLLIYRETSPQHWLQSGTGYDPSMQASMMGKRCVETDKRAAEQSVPMARDCAFVNAARDAGADKASGRASAATAAATSRRSSGTGSIIDDVNVAILPIFGPSTSRDDEHPLQKFYRLSIPGAQLPSPRQVLPDCTHYCQGGAMFRYWSGALIALVKGAAARRAAQRRGGLKMADAAAAPLQQMLIKACGT